jgi:hypothetical protein
MTRSRQHPPPDLSPLLNYAPPPKRRPWHLVLSSLVARVSILLCLGMAVFLSLVPLLEDYHYAKPGGDPSLFWKALFNGWAAVVDNGGPRIIYASGSQNVHDYYWVDQKAALAAADRAAQDYVKQIISQLPRRYDPESRATAALRVLTGQDLTTRDQWQAWSKTHLGELKGGFSFYYQLLALRSNSPRDDSVIQAHRRQIYLAATTGFWRQPSHLLEALNILLCLIVLFLVARRFARQARLRRALITR